MPTFTTTFDPTKAVNSRRQRLDFTPTGGSLTKIACRMIDVDGKLTTSILKQPGSDDINREVAEVATDAEETITLVDVDEIETVVAALSGLNGLVLGTAKIYIKDPRDATGVSKASITGAAAAAFACSVKRPDGAIRIGNTDWSKTSLVVRNLSGTKLSWNAAVASPDA